MDTILTSLCVFRAVLSGDVISDGEVVKVL